MLVLQLISNLEYFWFGFKHERVGGLLEDSLHYFVTFVLTEHRSTKLFFCAEKDAFQLKISLN